MMNFEAYSLPLCVCVCARHPCLGCQTLQCFWYSLPLCVCASPLPRVSNIAMFLVYPLSEVARGVFRIIDLDIRCEKQHFVSRRCFKEVVNREKLVKLGN